MIGIDSGILGRGRGLTEGDMLVVKEWILRASDLMLETIQVTGSVDLASRRDEVLTRFNRALYNYYNLQQ